MAIRIFYENRTSMNKITLTIGMVVSVFVLFAQNTIELTFTAENNGQFIPLDSIVIENLTQGGGTQLIYPDTVLFLDFITGINNPQSSRQNKPIMSQNFPNPFADKTSFNVLLAENDILRIVIYNILGQEITNFKSELVKGEHNFIFYPGNDNNYVAVVYTSSGSQSIKLSCFNTRMSGDCKIEHTGFTNTNAKSKQVLNPVNFNFEIGDELLCIGYLNGMESGIVDFPEISKDYIFQFAYDIPCPGTPTITYEGQTYNTVQIFSQCWMKESMNHEIENSWCINNNPDYCDEFGRLYLWEATIDLCPTGWHLPSDNEWKILEGTTDSLYGIQDPNWNQSGGWRGFNSGGNLKSLTGWLQGGNGVDMYGFSAKPGGYQLPNGNNGAATIEVGFWTSTEYENDYAWHRFLQYSSPWVYRYPFEKEWGLYVRCVKD